MEQLNYKLEVFEGPLDLLLSLIAKHKLNINDIPIVELVDQYVSYVNSMQEADMYVASEFIEMAARLIYIKTVSLLPKYEEGEQLKEELQGELIAYKTCKEVAKQLSENTDGFNRFVRDMEKVEPDRTYTRLHEASELINAYISAAGKRLRMLPPSIDAFSGIVAKKIVSVSSKFRTIYSKLKKGKKTKFNSLFEDAETRSDLVATFLAVLEMTKLKKIMILGDGNSAEIELLDEDMELTDSEEWT
jgi:segregation and condensation protein A